MRRCPSCAESVQSAARVCRFCGHAFAEPDEIGDVNDMLRRGAGKIGSIALALVLFYLAYACVEGAALDQQQKHSAPPVTNLPIR